MHSLVHLIDVRKKFNGAAALEPIELSFARLMEAATQIQCSEFGDNVISRTCD